MSKRLFPASGLASSTQWASMLLTEEQRRLQERSCGGVVSTKLDATREIGSYPWFSTTSLLYHTQVCHSEPSGENPG